MRTGRKKKKAKRNWKKWGVGALKKRIERLGQTGPNGPAALSRQFWKPSEATCSDFRDKILNGDYFKRSDE